MNALSFKLSPATEARMLRVSLRNVRQVVHRAMVTAGNCTLQDRIQKAATPEQALAIARVRMLLAEADTIMSGTCKG